MKIVGLNIDEGRVSATVIQRQFGRTELLDSFVRTYDGDENLSAILREKAVLWSGARIISSIPGRFFTQRALTFPFADRKRIEKALPFELEDLLPFELDDVLLDHLVLESGKGKEQGTRVLAVVLPKSVLRRHLDLLAGAGLEPHTVIPSFAGLASVNRLLPSDGTMLLLNGRDACLTANGTIRSLRSVRTAASGGMRQVLQAFGTEQKERIERAVLLGSDDDTRTLLTEEGVAFEQVVPELGGKKVTDASSLGTAMTAGLNLRQGEFAYRLADEGTRRRRRTLIIAGAAAAVLFSMNIGVKTYLVRSGYDRLDREIRASYQEVFPDARTAGDPLRSMRDKLAEAKRMYGALGTSTSTLDVMKTVTDGIPPEIRASFAEFLLEGDRLRLAGEVSSFESVDRIKAEFGKSPLFSDVVVQDTRMGVDNKVKFRFEIKLKQAM